MEGLERIRLIIETLLKGLVDDESKVEVTIRRGDQTTVFEVRAAKSDIGKIIGKKGSMATAIRTYLSAIGVKHNARCILDILD